jgi:predicted nucleic acid-binding protein
MTVTADTNVFVYSVDGRDPVKQQTARQVFAALANADSLVALQVVGELQNALHRRLKAPVHLASQQARNVFATFRSFGYAPYAVDIALAQSAAGRLSYWDALLLASCAQAGLTVLLSEDMQDGFKLGGVEVVNPFGPSGLSARAREVLGL